MIKRRWAIYILLLIISIIAIGFLLDFGKNIHQEFITPAKNINQFNIQEFLSNLYHHVASPLSILIIQIIVIVSISRIFGKLFSKIGQPSVIGEIIAGIALGPSILGYFFPDIFTFIFPIESLNNLGFLSQIGLVLFMFVIGMELDISTIKKKAGDSFFISHTSIAISFILGIICAIFIYSEYVIKSINFIDFALFIGIAMSIAAFPVLARIVQEKGLSKSNFGKQIITIAAIDDLTAWCLFATIIIIIKSGSIISVLFTIILIVLFVFVMFYWVQPLLKRFDNTYKNRELLTKNIVSVVFIILFLSALLTELIGIKALFGGFIAGVIMPANNNFKKMMSEKIEDFSLIVLLPLFFALTGLRTEIGLLNSSEMWIVCLIIIAVAITGKLGGSFLASKIVGYSTKDSLFIGTLMNTRGLMELILLNIGYDMGILPANIFAIMVVMTLVTTFMTGPLLTIIEKYYKTKEKAQLKPSFKSINILISFGIPKTGKALLQIAHGLVGSNNIHKITALHLTPQSEVSIANAINYQNDNFKELEQEAKNLKIDINCVYKTSAEVSKEISKSVEDEQCKVLLIGAGRGNDENSILSDRTKNIINAVKCNYGVFFEKDFSSLNNIVVIGNKKTMFPLVNIAKRLSLNNSSKVNIVSIDSCFSKDIDFKQYVNLSIADFTENIKIREEVFDELNYNSFNLIISNLDLAENTEEIKKLVYNLPKSILLIKFTDNTFSHQDIN